MWLLYVGFVALNTVNNTMQLDCHRQRTMECALKELTARKFRRVSIVRNRALCQTQGIYKYNLTT